MAKKTENLRHEKRNGVTYALHPTGIENGDVDVGLAPVEIFTSLKQVEVAIEAGRYSEQFICEVIHSKLTIATQQAIRTACDGGKFTKDKAFEYVMKLPAEIQAKVFGNREMAIAAAKELWESEQGDDVAFDTKKVWWDKAIGVKL